MNYYVDYDWYRGYNDNSLEMPKDGFLKGNLFSQLYSEYKGYQPVKLKPSNEREMKLYELGEYSFAAHELNLYLDVHPDDQSMFMLFKDYQKKANNLLEEYERMYGPLSISSDDKSFTWNKNWPWEGRNV